jgi:hypothetical protein
MSTTRFTIFPSFFLNGKGEGYYPEFYEYKEGNTFEKSKSRPPQTDYQILKEKHPDCYYKKFNNISYFWINQLFPTSTVYYKFVDGKEEKLFQTDSKTSLLKTEGNSFVLLKDPNSIELWKHKDLSKGYRNVRISTCTDSSPIYFSDKFGEFYSLDDNFNKKKIEELTEGIGFILKFLVIGDQLIRGTMFNLYFYNLQTLELEQTIDINFPSSKGELVFNLIAITQNLFFFQYSKNGQLYSKLDDKWILLQSFKFGFNEQLDLITIPKKRKDLLPFAKSLKVKLPLELLLEVTEFCVDS